MGRRQRSGEVILGAERIRAEGAGAPSQLADRYEMKGREPVPADARRTAGGELVPDDDFATSTLPALLDTLANPDAVAADASRDRLDLAQRAGSLEMALDTADTIQAADGLERMLAHQMATAHACAMKTAAVLNGLLDHADRTRGAERQMACVEAARMASAYARLSGSFQAGMQTLQRMRSGGRQVVVVQHNTVKDGGQAVIGGAVGGGGARRKQASGG